MSILTVVPPAVEPVTLEQALLWCRAPSDDAPLVQTLIKAARERAEHLTQRVFVQRTMQFAGSSFYAGAASFAPWITDPDYWRAKLSETPPSPGAPAIELVAPVQSIEEIQYLNPAGQLQTFAGPVTLDNTCEPAWVRFDAATLPPVQPRMPYAVRVRFVAGYPPVVAAGRPDDPCGNLPAALLQWMQVQISTWYTQRESIVLGRLVELSRNFADALLDGLIVSTRYT